jgi:hypothetical protein
MFEAGYRSAIFFAGCRFGAMSTATSAASRDIENHEGCQRDPN